MYSSDQHGEGEEWGAADLGASNETRMTKPPLTLASNRSFVLPAIGAAAMQHREVNVQRLLVLFRTRCDGTDSR